jgi:hypothetical protein
VAARFDVSLAWVYRVLQRRRVAAPLAALVPLLIVNSFSKASPKSKDWRTAVITSAFVVAFMLIAGADALPPSIPRTALLVSTTCMICSQPVVKVRLKPCNCTRVGAAKIPEGASDRWRPIINLLAISAGSHHFEHWTANLLADLAHALDVRRVNRLALTAPHLEMERQLLLDLLVDRGAPQPRAQQTLHHWSLNAVAGSTLVARQAGAKQAAAAVSAATTGTTANVTGSSGVTG